MIVIRAAAANVTNARTCAEMIAMLPRNENSVCSINLLINQDMMDLLNAMGYHQGRRLGVSKEGRWPSCGTLENPPVPMGKDLPTEFPSWKG